MAVLEDPETDALDFAGLTALLNRRARSVREHYSALRNALLRGHGAALSDRERSLISNMLHVLISDIGIALGNALAEGNSSGNSASSALAASLNNGWTSSMYGRLAKAGALGDLDLIGLLTHRMAEHLLEAKSRQAMNSALAEGRHVGDTEAPFAEGEITGNPVMAQAISEYMVERSRRFDGYGNPRLSLSELPPELRDRLFWTCAAAWREDLLPERTLDEADADDALEQAVFHALDALDREGKRQQLATAVADAVVGAVTDMETSAALAKDALIRGHVAVFEALQARSLNIPLSVARSMTFEPGGARLAIAARAAQFTRRDFVEISDHIVQTRNDAAREYADAVDVFDACTPADAARLVREMRRRPEYLQAIGRLRGPEAEGEDG